jgi:hypothetical protein
MRRTISIVDLRAHGACADQLALFRATFGDTPVAVTEVNMSRAVDVGLQIEWLECFLAAPALAAFETARAPAWAAFQADDAPAWAAFQADDAPAWAAFETARAQAWESYRRALVGPLVRALRAEGGA